MRDFIKNHTGLTIIIVAALLVELTTGFIYYNSQEIIKSTTTKVMERENNALYLCIRNKLIEVEVVLDNMSWIVTDDLIQPDSLTRETYQIVQNNPNPGDVKKNAVIIQTFIFAANIQKKNGTSKYFSIYLILIR